MRQVLLYAVHIYTIGLLVRVIVQCSKLLTVCHATTNGTIYYYIICIQVARFYGPCHIQYYTMAEMHAWKDGCHQVETS